MTFACVEDQIIKWYPLKKTWRYQIACLRTSEECPEKNIICVYGGRGESSCFYLEGINFEPEIFFRKSYIISSLDAFLGYMYFVFSFPQFSLIVFIYVSGTTLQRAYTLSDFRSRLYEWLILVGYIRPIYVPKSESSQYVNHMYFFLMPWGDHHLLIFEKRFFMGGEGTEVFEIFPDEKLTLYATIIRCAVTSGK